MKIRRGIFLLYIDLSQICCIIDISNESVGLMTEKQIFSKKRVKFDALVDYGFVYENGAYVYNETFMDGDFRAEVRIDGDGNVDGSVFDAFDGEEYLPIKVKNSVGAFVGEVRKAYADILQRIADSCFENERFIYEQTNRIARMIERRYGETPDYPFSTAPTYAVFRYPKNRKWYALVMDIRRHLLTKEEVSNPEDSPVIEVLNVKVDPAAYDETMKLPAVYPCYHMNRANWISILLDGSLDDEQIMALIDVSRNFAVGKSKREKSMSWIVPANPKYYDVQGAFAESDEVMWKQARGARTGDTVYMYVAAPISAVLYKCTVLEDNIPFSHTDKNVSMTHIMKLRLIEQYPPERFPVSVLRTLGIKLLRGPIPATEEFINEANKTV